MSDSDRKHLSATLRKNWRPLAVFAGGLVVSFYLFAALRPERPYLPAYKPTYERPQNYQPGGNKCRPSALASVRDSRKRSVKAENCEADAEQYRLQTDDLIQQTRAADASQAQTLLAYDQGWVSLWATLGGLWTLIAAGLAAAYARDAARHAHEGVIAARASLTFAEQSAAAADLAVKEAQRIGEAQVRAYLTGISAEIGYLKDETVIAKIMIKNSGQSPAQRVQISGTIRHFHEKTFLRTGEIAADYPVFEHDIAAQSEEEITTCFQMRFSEDEVVAINSGNTIRVSLNILISAKDVFGLPITGSSYFSMGVAHVPDSSKWLEMARTSRISKDWQDPK